MGTTFVTLGRDADGSPTSDHGEIAGFWMQDSMLELWLRLLALHIAEPDPDKEVSATIRNQWLLASRFGFVGCVPHDLEKATATPQGFGLVVDAVTALSSALASAGAHLSCSTLNLMGFGTVWQRDIDVADLRDVAAAFQDLLNFKVTTTASSRTKMPGTRRASFH